MTKLRLQSLESENQETKSNICTLNVELAEANKMLSENQPLVSLCDQLSKLKSIKNGHPFWLQIDLCYGPSSDKKSFTSGNLYWSWINSR